MTSSKGNDLRGRYCPRYYRKKKRIIYKNANLRVVKILPQNASEWGVLSLDGASESLCTSCIHYGPEFWKRTSGARLSEKVTLFYIKNGSKTGLIKNVSANFISEKNFTIYKDKTVIFVFKIASLIPV